MIQQLKTRLNVIAEKALTNVVKLLPKPYMRIRYFGRVYVTAVVQSNDEYAFSFSYKKPLSQKHRVISVCMLPYDVPEWIGRETN